MCASTFYLHMTAKDMAAALALSPAHLTTNPGLCRSCPRHANCSWDGGGSTLETLGVPAGYWRDSVRTTELHACGQPAVCIGSVGRGQAELRDEGLELGGGGGAAGAVGGSDATLAGGEGGEEGLGGGETGRGGGDADGPSPPSLNASSNHTRRSLFEPRAPVLSPARGFYCAEGHTGPRCEACTHPHHYNDDHGCTACPPAGRIAAAAGACVLAAAVAALCYVCLRRAGRLRAAWAWGCGLASLLGLQAKIKIAISFYQVAPQSTLAHP
jgi:hypothetical protein